LKHSTRPAENALLHLAGEKVKVTRLKTFGSFDLYLPHFGVELEEVVGTQDGIVEPACFMKQSLQGFVTGGREDEAPEGGIVRAGMVDTSTARIGRISASAGSQKKFLTE
jgi:hypothetical protein